MNSTKHRVPLLVLVAWTSLQNLAAVFVLVMSPHAQVQGAEFDAEAAATRGYTWLTQQPFLSADFDQEVFDQLWTVWPKELKEQAELATPAERQQMAFSRYGLAGRPEDPTQPLQYVVAEDGKWTMNCFACHGGKLRGQTIPGLPNSHYALETLTADVRKVKIAMKRPLSSMDAGSVFMPLGKSNGTTNAVMFGVALMSYRDQELRFDASRRPPKMIHHDMDAPAWWTFKKKKHLYIDGFAQKAPRPLMQFMLVQENGPQEFAAAASKFEDVFHYLQNLEAPAYPFSIDSKLAEQGREVFNDNCASCHGTYGESPTYPEKVIPLDELGTDPVRLTALTKKDRDLYHRSWFAHFGEHKTVLEPKGYVAPPLDGIWASAPYFHNGSVPTLWHVLNPEQRPAVWKRSETGYDEQRVGLEVEEFPRLPSNLRRSDQLRSYFNTRMFGKRSDGHDFPDALDQQEKAAVLEYLKSL